MRRLMSECVDCNQTTIYNIFFSIFRAILTSVYEHGKNPTNLIINVDGLLMLLRFSFFMLGSVIRNVIGRYVVLTNKDSFRR